MTNSAPVVTLRTLGQLELTSTEGGTLDTVLAHSKRAALLVYLAVATPRGFQRRDALLALFWPELDQERARASLRKALHHLRRSLGSDALVGRGDEELKLDPALVQCDAVSFEQALAAQNPDHALQLYRGPFLHAFFVSDAPEFERWADRERARLQRLACEGAWSAAARDEAGGNAFSAAHWGRRAAELVPDDEDAVRRLVALLDRLGDRAGAVATYEEFAARLRRDYNVAPDPRTATQIQAVRARTAAGAVPPSPPPVATPPPAAAPVTAARLRSRRALAGMISVAVAGLALAGAWQLGPLRPRAARAATASTVAVFPFQFRGSPPLAYLGDGMVSLLGTALDGTGGLHAVDASALLAELPRDAAASLAPATALSLADRLGAGRVVLGEIVEVEGRLRVSAAVYDGVGEAPRVRAAVEGALDDLFALVDRLAAQLVIAPDGEPFTALAARTTRSLPALKAYLEGERDFRRGHYKTAVAAFHNATALDSTFALAHYRLALALSWSTDPGVRAAAEQAVRYADRLAPPDRALLEAFLAFVNGDADEAERRYRAILGTRPFEAEVWDPLGEVLFHYNPLRGRPVAESQGAFERALAYGPKDAPLTHLIELAAMRRDSVAFDTLIPGIAPGAHFDLVGRTMRALAHGDAAVRARMLTELRNVSDADAVVTARHILFLVEDRRDAGDVVRILTGAARPPELRAMGFILLAHVEAGAGRWRAADSLLAQAEALDRAQALEHQALLYSLPFAPIPRARLDAIRAALEAWHPDSLGGSVVIPGDRALHRHVREYLLGGLDARLGDFAAARRRADALARLGGPDEVRRLAVDLALGVRARVAWEEGRPAEALRLLEATTINAGPLDLIGVVPFYEQPLERFLRAEALHRVGRQEEALGWYASFVGHSAFGRAFLAAAELRQGEIAEAAGRRGGAAAHFARALDLWSECDASLQPTRDAARARHTRLRAEEQ